MVGLCEFVDIVKHKYGFPEVNGGNFHIILTFRRYASPNFHTVGVHHCKYIANNSNSVLQLIYIDSNHSQVH